MAFFKTGQLLMKQIFKTEIMVKKFLKENIPISMVVDKYIHEIKNNNHNLSKISALELLDFPFKTFYKLNQNYMKNIITATYDMLKEKGLSKDSSVFGKYLQSSTYYGINIELETVLKELIDNQMALDEFICDVIIMDYSSRGQMKAVEMLLEEMESKGIRCSYRNKYSIACGYIIAGQPEKAEIFIKKNNLNMKSHDMFYRRCLAYSSIGDVASLKNVLAEMFAENKNLSPARYCDIYEKLICGNVDKSDLFEIIDLTKSRINENPTKLFNLFHILNSADKFNDSIIILEKLIDMINNPIEILEQFGKRKCPLNTFDKALTMLAPKCRGVARQICIFDEIDFDTAFDICKKFSEIQGWKVIYYSILNKALSEKSPHFIEKVLNFSFINLTPSDIFTILYQCFLPSMLDKNMVSNYEEILELFPALRNEILPVILMKYLCSGDFDRCEVLIEKDNISEIHLIFNCGLLTNDIQTNFTLKEIKKFSIEARKYFLEQCVNEILCYIFVNEVVKLSNSKSTNEIKEIIGFAKEWDIELSQSKINYLSRFAPSVAKLILASIVAKNDVISNNVSSN